MASTLQGPSYNMTAKSVSEREYSTESSCRGGRVSIISSGMKRYCSAAYVGWPGPANTKAQDTADSLKPSDSVLERPDPVNAEAQDSAGFHRLTMVK